MKKHLSLSQRIHNAEGAQAVEYLHARHSYLHAKNFGLEEYAVIWSRRDDVSWAHGFGRWRGWDKLMYAHVTKYLWRGLGIYKDVYDKVPEITRLTDFRAIGELALHSLTTDIIEVADDGESARAFFQTPGVISSAPNPNGKFRGGPLWERYGADYVFEDGEWKYLHEHVCPDLGDIGGGIDQTNIGVKEYQQLINPPKEKLEMPEDPFPMLLDDPGPLHNEYTLLQTVQDTVPWPEPYVTMDEDHTYTKKK